MLNLIDLAQEECLFVFNIKGVKVWCCSMFCNSFQFRYHNHLVAPIDQKLTTITELYFKIVCKFLERESMSRKRLFLMINLYTEFLEELLSDAVKSFIMPLPLTLSYSISSAFLNTKAIYMPGEWGMNNNLSPSLALKKLICSYAFEVIALANEFSHVSEFAIFKVVHASSLILRSRFSFSFC